VNLLDSFHLRPTQANIRYFNGAIRLLLFCLAIIVAYSYFFRPVPAWVFVLGWMLFVALVLGFLAKLFLSAAKNMSSDPVPAARPRR
jgi:small-conductance mechanosensitive channel